MNGFGVFGCDGPELPQSLIDRKCRNYEGACLAQFLRDLLPTVLVIY